MSKTIVSILSEHLIPNLIFIREMEGTYSDLLFITTPLMEQRRSGIHLEIALGLKPESVRRVVVPNDSYRTILRELEAADLPEGQEYLVNITGGTKMMSLAVVRYFDRYPSHLVYVPLGTNVYYDLSSEEPYAITYRVTLEEYLTLYGLSYEYDNSLIHGQHKPFSIFDYMRRKDFVIPRHYTHANENDWLEPTERRYMAGEWLEEYTYLRIKKDFHLRDEDIAKSVKIYRDDPTHNDNELDVTFVRDNALYVIECKVTMYGYGKKPKEMVEEYLYKLAAISKDFGLRVNSYLFTLHKMREMPPETQENIKKRMRILGIRGIVDGQKLTDKIIDL